jgi:predicted metal-dependent phosphoesterase TrpH
LHIHTTHSDGAYTSAQVVELARRSGLAAVALTDHDTLSGIAPARAAAGAAVEVVAGVEISAEYEGQEFHLLAYFFRPDDAALQAALGRLATQRADRFWTMVERLRACGVHLATEDLPRQNQSEVLGRRNLAEILVKTRWAGSVREAFARYLRNDGRVVVPKARLPVAEAIALVRGAGGVAGWAHPPYDCESASLAELQSLGLGALEVSYPGYRSGRMRSLRALAAELGLAVTGGSDCHGPDQPGRAVGTCSVTKAELELLRQRASR